MADNINRIDDIVRSGYCMGCGLCVSLAAPGKIKMVSGFRKRPRPQVVNALSEVEEADISRLCPGINITGIPNPQGYDMDPVWGNLGWVTKGWAADPKVRFAAATGGIMTAVGQHLVRTGRAKFLLHVIADPDKPLHSNIKISRSADEVFDGRASRYGPVSPLTAIHELLELGEPFAAALKPCDIAAIRNLQREDPRARELIVFTMAMFCGTTPDLEPNEVFLARHGLDETGLNDFQWRGNGCPGPTRATTKTGETLDATYRDLWVETPYTAQFRCRICPDAIGDAADLATGDSWSGGKPTGESDGVNANVCHTPIGVEVLKEAEAAGAVVLEPFTLEDLYDVQPHHVRLKQQLSTRLGAMEAQGNWLPRFDGMRIAKLGEALTTDEQHDVFEATKMRLEAGKATEPTY